MVGNKNEQIIYIISQKFLNFFIVFLSIPRG